MTTEERLEKLEHELARAKRRNRCLMIGAAICLGIVFAWLFSARPGRYALSGFGGAVYVLDTRTSQLWERKIDVTSGDRGQAVPWVCVDEFGTNEKPAYARTKTQMQHVKD